MTDACPAPLDDTELAATWSAAWSDVGHQAPGGLQSKLMTAWSEPHRHYHDQRHLRECLALWARWCDPCERPGEVAIALWFVDAIYVPRDGSNEPNSAALAARSLTRAGAGADRDTAQRVHDLVMATRSTKLRRRWGRVPTHGRNIDLSILGSPAERFERYDQDLRKEYAWVPGYRYQDARAQALQNFLDRTRLYTFALACTPVM